MARIAAASSEAWLLLFCISMQDVVERFEISRRRLLDAVGNPVDGGDSGE